jgi:hypothetical protein
MLVTGQETPLLSVEERVVARLKLDKDKEKILLTLHKPFKRLQRLLRLL